MKLSNSLFECDYCHWKGYPGFELAGAKLIAQCGNGECSRTDHRYTPADFSTGVAKVNGEEFVVDVASGEKSEPTMVMPKLTATAPVAAPAPMPRPMAAPADVLALIRARRDYLEAEIAKIEPMKIELRKLTKMIQAANRVDAQNGAPVAITFKN